MDQLDRLSLFCREQGTCPPGVAVNHLNAPPRLRSTQPVSRDPAHIRVSLDSPSQERRIAPGQSAQQRARTAARVENALDSKRADDFQGGLICRGVSNAIERLCQEALGGQS